MKSINNLIINCSKPTLVDVFFNENYQQKPIVIFCHGYKGFKDWGAWNIMSEKFAESGFFFVKFNFSFNGGTIHNPIDFDDLKSFGENTYTKEVNDIQSIISWITETNDYKNEIDINKIYIIGHSRGGGITTIASSIDSRIKKLVTWASVSNFEGRFPFGDELEKWRKEGVYYVKNGRTNQNMPHYFSFYTDFEQNKELLNIEQAAKKIEIPHLIIHGEKDETVSVDEAFNLHKWNKNSTINIVSNANHTFGSVHPWEKNILPESLDMIVQSTIDFFKK